MAQNELTAISYGAMIYHINPINRNNISVVMICYNDLYASGYFTISSFFFMLIQIAYF